MNEIPKLIAEYEAEHDHMKIISTMGPVATGKLCATLLDMPGVRDAMEAVVLGDMADDDRVEPVAEETAK